ncbi:hypothetical protein BDV18DRAFT_160003 [Aspergillus unguis]
MPRHDFQKDLAEAHHQTTFPRLTEIKSGSEDGSFFFTYTSPTDDESINVEVTALDTSQYPKSHTYLVFTVSDNVPEDVTKSLEDSMATFRGLSVHEFLAAVAECLDRAISADESSSDCMEDDTGFESESELDDMDLNGDMGGLYPGESVTGVRDYIRKDLRAARRAGFRVGLLGELRGAMILSASRRISKLGISNEAMEAWGVRPSEYLVLLVRYPYGYRRFEEVVESMAGSTLIQLYVGVCEKYKPSLNSAIHAFINKPATGTGPDDATANLENMEPVLGSIFIGKSLEALLNTRFTDILKYRLKNGFSWTGAELFLNDGQGKILDADEIRQPKYYEPEKWRVPPPDILKNDHLVQVSSRSDMSLLLIAMQFTLRRFVKCTEFCLNCYCKIDAGFEALKPFVCSKGLCLYQYMSLGMGPSLEWEITSQPYVVDLLISFAYTRAGKGKLEDFPLDFPLKVPPHDRKPADCPKGQLRIDPKLGPCLRMENNHELKEGDWVALMLSSAACGKTANPAPPLFSNPFAASSYTPNFQSEMHARVKSVSDRENVALSDLISSGNPTNEGAWNDPIARTVCVVTYDTDLASLNETSRLFSISELLNTLPSVSEMKGYIDKKHSGHLRPLSQWQDRISKSALYILQWIIGSNRSVILYDEDPQHQVPGMESYVQFRFAQGAPDKEQRFVSAVNKTASRLGLKYPTLFAWHGSPLNNWHSILREGFHYRDVVNGRANGHGIYMAPDFHTSLNYCQSHRYPPSTTHHWPRSELKCSMAISLNEVINAPEDFQASIPHYVVQHLDWVQPRYLFIDRGASAADYIRAPKREKLAHVYAQDPNRIVRGPTGPLTIPISATNSHRSRNVVQSTDSEPTTKAVKKRKGKGKVLVTPAPTHKNEVLDDHDDDVASMATLEEDRLLLLSDDETNELPSRKSKAIVPAHIRDSLTSFQPGMLDTSCIQLLGEPQYATQGATRSIQKRLKQALATQNTQPQHELGWYINDNLIDNMYQWIVELHSFNQSLQLAKDLQKAKLSSIVMEIRFPSDFPLAPPFIRVIRPRFVRFAEGGGGHITAGGAMCMELLTTSGWLPSYSIENVLVQIRLAITNELPRPAKLDLAAARQEYSIGEALSEYRRVCAAHGWKIPKDLEQLRWQ